MLSQSYILNEFMYEAEGGVDKVSATISHQVWIYLALFLATISDNDNNN